jgi:undecaprenyl-diphosphatase
MESFNQTLFLALNNLAGKNHYTNLFIIFCAQYLAYIIIASTLAYIYFHTDWRKGMREVLVIFFSAVLSYIIASTIKHFYLHDRPFMFFSDLVPLISPDSPHGSFPSGHATFFSALGFAFLYYEKRVGALYLLGALIIGLARIIAGVHWPLDILAGYLLGGIIVFGVHFTITKLKLHDRLGLTVPA